MGITSRGHDSDVEKRIEQSNPRSSATLSSLQSLASPTRTLALLTVAGTVFFSFGLFTPVAVFPRWVTRLGSYGPFTESNIMHDLFLKERALLGDTERDGKSSTSPFEGKLMQDVANDEDEGHDEPMAGKSGKGGKSGKAKGGKSGPPPAPKTEKELALERWENSVGTAQDSFESDEPMAGKSGKGGKSGKAKGGKSGPPPAPKTEKELALDKWVELESDEPMAGKSGKGGKSGKAKGGKSGPPPAPKTEKELAEESTSTIDSVNSPRRFIVKERPLKFIKLSDA